MNDALPKSADIVIVGGGMAGLELAKELDRLGGRKVVVLEAGPADDVAHINSVNDAQDALRFWLEPGVDPHHWLPWTSASEPHFKVMAGLRRRLGGRSLYWHGVILELEPWALAEPWWPAEIVEELTTRWQGGPGLYDVVRSELAAWTGPRADASEPLELGGHHLVPVPQAIRSAPGGDGQRWAAYSPASYWTAERRAAAGTQIVPDAEVLTTTVSEGRVSGVVVRLPGESEPSVIHSDVVVVAAGTVENSRLVVQTLEQAGRPTDHTVHGLVDHIVQGFVAALPAEDLPAEIVGLADRDAFFYAPGPEETRSNLFVSLYRNSTGAVVFDVWTMGEQLPSEAGQVRCLPGSSPQWEVQVSTEVSSVDRDVIAAQRDVLQRFWAAVPGLVDTARPVLKFPSFDNPDQTLESLLLTVDAMAPTGLPMAWNGPLGSEYHESSTLPIGRLLTTEQEVVGVPGLYAAGPCVYPRPGAANPSLTSLALAKRLAAVLAS
jgi:choline dehydrogenase-like flavoprotein